ncbi:sugar phosphate isomerase/epimerase family protein [Planctomycetota bacterium]
MPESYMINQQNKAEGCPPIGMALWLLAGGHLIDRIEWVISNGFQGISLLQSAMDIDVEERKDVAAAITAAKLYVTYHGNVHHKLNESGELDTDFADRMIDDVVWWHENTNGVYSCCSDSIKAVREDGTAVFDFDLNKQHMDMIAGRLNTYGIHVGIENGCGGKNRFCTIDDFVRIKEMCSGSDVGMLLDAGHANIHVRSDGVENEDNITSYVSKIPFEIREVHFSDNVGKQDEHKQLGYGNLNLSDLFKAFKNREFTGKFTVEVCVDILSGKYGSDINDPKQTDALLVSRDKITAAWADLE